MLMVFDEDQPVISLETDNISVDEGDLMTFRVRSDKALTTDLFVAIEFSPSSMITGESTKIVELLSTNTDLFVEFQVQTVDNEIKTNPQKLIASIKNGNNYAPSTDSNHQVVITINDNDEKPTYSIAPNASQLAGIIEGRTAKYVVTASHPIDEKVTLSYELTEVGNFLLTDQNNEITLKPLVQTAEIQALTDNDGLVESDGVVTVTLIPSAETSIASSPDNEASITIIDNDTLNAPNGQLYSTGFDNRLPRLSLAINTNQHPNGFATSKSPFSFQVISDKYLHSAIPAVNITQVDSGSPSPQNFTTELPVNTISSIVSRTSSGNEMRLTIQPGDGYTVGTPNSITITRVSQQTGIAIVASSEFISESEQAKFTIISQLTNTSPLNVDIILDQGVNDFIDGSLERTVTFQPSSVGTQLVVDLIDDQIDENSGKITATVMPGASYLVSPINNSAVIYVNDNDDPPIMSISTSQTSISEGESAEFQVSAEGQWSQEILVQLNIIDTGNFVNTNSRLVTFAPNSEDTGEVINVSIPTIQDGLIEQDGTLTVSILPNNAFNKRKLYSIANFQFKCASTS